MSGLIDGPETHDALAAPRDGWDIVHFCDLTGLSRGLRVGKHCPDCVSASAADETGAFGLGGRIGAWSVVGGQGACLALRADFHDLVLTEDDAPDIRCTAIATFDCRLDAVPARADDRLGHVGLALRTIGEKGAPAVSVTGVEAADRSGQPLLDQQTARIRTGLQDWISRTETLAAFDHVFAALDLSGCAAHDGQLHLGYCILPGANARAARLALTWSCARPSSEKDEGADRLLPDLDQVSDGYRISAMVSKTMLPPGVEALVTVRTIAGMADWPGVDPCRDQVIISGASYLMLASPMPPDTVACDRHTAPKRAGSVGKGEYHAS